MPRKSHTSYQSRRLRVLRRGVTRSASDFNYLCRNAPHRVGIIAEGDSWFSYPRKYLIAGPDINLVHHLEDVVSGSDAVNLLVRSSNGDEAAAMLAGKQKYSMAKLLETNAEQINIILFSGGGNDLVGRYDMDRLLRSYKPGYSAQDCIDQERLDRKLQRILLAYSELLELRNSYAPEAIVVTHTYDQVRPSNKGARLLKFYKTGPWILPFLEQKGIPKALHADISKVLLDRLSRSLQELANSALAAERFVVVDTQGTLRPGHASDWLNEIHPTASGFKRLFKLIYTAMCSVDSRLPKHS